jgi:pimeloyl-ACP methyl ester carboxylesterase
MGVDLGAYNSTESAADMNDLRDLLGIKKWNLYGISYSTRLMLNYVREYPTNVRSIILDSVMPPTANWDETGIENVVKSLDMIFKACSDDKACSAKYPDLEDLFNKTVKDLDRSPATVEAVVNDKTTPVKLIGRDFVDLIYNLLEGTNSLRFIPWTIDAVSRQNYDPLKTYAENALTSGGFIWGMRYSVWCTEEMPFQSRRKISAMVTRYPDLGGFSIQGAFPQICKVWNVPAAKPIENEMVKIPVPVLIYGGEFDPDTPPDWGKTVASWSDKGYFCMVRSTSHQAMGRRCTFAEMPIAFLNDPDTKPDSKCLDEIEAVQFK